MTMAKCLVNHRIYDFEKDRQKQVCIIVIAKLRLSCQKLLCKKKSVLQKNIGKGIFLQILQKFGFFSLFIEQLPTTVLEN